MPSQPTTQRRHKALWGLGILCLTAPGLLGCFSESKATSPPDKQALPSTKTPKRPQTAQRRQQRQTMTLHTSTLWAKVYTNDKLVGMTSYLPSGNKGIILNVIDKELRVRIEKAGYRTWRRRFSPAQQKMPFDVVKLEPTANTPNLSRRLRRLQRVVARHPQSQRKRRRYQRALLRAKRYRQALKHIVEWRRWMPRSLSLLKQHVALQRRFSKQRAKHLLTEWVEFSPQDHNRWQSYGQYLQRTRRYKDSCEAFIKVIHLNPTATSLFQGIMDMRRRPNANPKQLQRCILRGVQQMPIERKLTIVMMWDADRTDIDMWVQEPSGDEVSYSRKQSKSGGVLYYDVTGGYGPEIYVNAQTTGRYRLRAAYFNGEASSTNVTFYVMKHAGSQRASVEKYKLTLDKRTAKQKQHVAWIRLNP